MQLTNFLLFLLYDHLTSSYYLPRLHLQYDVNGVRYLLPLFSFDFNIFYSS